jgi:hypothetical protein
MKGTKYLRQFCNLFTCLSHAGSVLSGVYDHDPKIGDQVCSYIDDAFINISKLVTIPRQSDLLSDLIDEIENNLYDYPESRVTYIEDVIRDFNTIVPYIDIDANIEWLDSGDVCRVKIGNAATLKLINEYCEGKKAYSDLSTSEKYVLSCSRLLDSFATLLDAKCLSFDIDLMNIQEQLNIFLFRQRNRASLFFLGYGEKLNSMSEKLKLKRTEDDLPKTLKSIFNREQLIKIKSKMNEKIIANISDDDFVYLLSEKPITKNMKRLYWKDSMPLCHAFLARVVYGVGQFNFRQVNECIKFPHDKKLDSNHKTNAYRNKDILDPILKL